MNLYAIVVDDDDPGANINLNRFHDHVELVAAHDDGAAGDYMQRYIPDEIITRGRARAVGSLYRVAVLEHVEDMVVTGDRDGIVLSGVTTE